MSPKPSFRIPTAALARPLACSWAMMVILLAGACDASASVGGGTSAVGATPTASRPTQTATPAGYPVKVYFSRHPDSDNNVNTVFPVARTSPTLGVGTYAIQQLIRGPAPSEAAQGYYTELTASLVGPSNCSGLDFQYTVDTATHTGTLRFCKTTSLAGDLTGPRIKAEITATLTQFPNVTKVIILNSQGHCFDDASGMDLCLRM